MSKYRHGVCPECKVKEGDPSKKTLYQCKLCERWFCTKHIEPRIAFIRDLKAISKYPEVRATLDKEWSREDGHPDFAYSLKRFKEFEREERLYSKLITDALDRSKAYRKKKSQREIALEELVPKPTTTKEPSRVPAPIKHNCPKCGSERIMITAAREEYDVFECLDCGFVWKYPSEQEPKLKSGRNKKFAIIGAITVVLILIVVVLVSMFAHSTVLRNESNLPIASFIPSKTTGIFVGEEIIFNASLSYDPDNSQGSGIITYTWDFDDGTPIETVSSYTVTHSYKVMKSYKVTLIVVDDDGQNATYTKSIEVKWEVPSISELRNWLALDRTNEINYDDPDFVCFDFAKMLANHSRQENWKMAVVCTYGYDTATNQSWKHAINAINMTEGLVYIEPQTDEVWWNNDHAEMVSGSVYKFWSYPYETVYVHIEDTLVLHLEDLEKYIWVPSCPPFIHLKDVSSKFY